MVRRFLVLMGLVVALAAFGCEGSSGGQAGDGNGNGDGGTPVDKPETDGKAIAKADEWNYINDPARFRVQFVFDWETLKGYSEGEAEQLPWPSDYWSYYEDSTNVRFHGENALSPMEKYDAAFNGWVADMSLKPFSSSRDCVDVKPGAGETWTAYVQVDREKSKAYYEHLGPAAKWQSENKGNGRMRDGRDSDSDGKTDECMAYGGSDEDYDGIETWWGLCHAWAPAAILEPEPAKSVTYNGVEFTVSDIKALLITQHDKSSSVMLGNRCNVKEVERDDVGRAIPEECRDTNPGSWHVVAVNMLAMQKRAFAMDRTYDYQVWNQPVLGFKVKEQREVPEAEAMELLGRAGKKYTEVFNSPNAVKWAYVSMDMKYITEAANHVEGSLTSDRSQYDRYVRSDNYRYIVEIDKDGQVVGGEWLPNVRAYPDFLWLPLTGNGGNPKVSTAKVKMLLELSRQADVPPPSDLTIKSFEDVLTGGLPIPDNDAVGVSRTLNVPDALTIGSLKVTVDIEHTYVGDLQVNLSHGGKTVTLHGQTGGNQKDLKKTFELGDFNGQSVQGDWELFISDNANVDTGKLNKWTLTVGTADTTSDATVVTIASGITTPVAIPDNDKDGVSAEATTTAGGTIDKLELALDITHTYIGDLEIALVHEDNMVVIHSREGGSADDIKKTYTVDGFRGAPVKGAWSLLVVDHAGQDVGTINGWTLKATVN